MCQATVSETWLCFFQVFWRASTSGFLSGRMFRYTLFITACKLLLVISQQNAPGYLGCYQDCDPLWPCLISDERVLSIGPTRSSSQSVEWCLRRCLEEESSSYKYAGLEYKNECFCGDNEDYDRHDEKDDSECQDRCTGNSDQFCGDSKRISIYKISDGVCSSDIGPPIHGTHNIANPPSVSYNLNNMKFFETRVNFSCDPGYTLHGASSIECIETDYNNVTWSDSVPTCEANLTTPVTNYTTQTAKAYTTVSNTSRPWDTDHTTDVGTGNNQATEELQTSHAKWTSTKIPSSTLESTKGPGSPIAGTLGTGEIAGIVVGALVAVTVLIVILVFLRRKRIRGTKQPRVPDIALDTVGVHYVNHIISNQVSDTSDTAQNHSTKDNAPPLYSQVIKDRPAVEGVTLPVSPQNDQDGDSGWVENEVYGCQSFPLESPTKNKDSDGQTNGQPPIANEEQSGWVENIIYEST